MKMRNVKSLIRKDDFQGGNSTFEEGYETPKLYLD